MARTKKKTIEEIYPEAFQALRNINLLKSVYQTSNQRLADAAGISLRTLGSRKAAPWTFTIGELQNIANVWELNATDLFGELKLVGVTG